MVEVLLASSDREALPELPTTAGRWWIVISMVAAMAVSAGAVTQFGISISQAYIVRDLHWSRGGVSSAISLFMLSLAISVPLAGALVDRFGARLPAIGSILLFAAALALTSLSPSATAFTLLLPIAGLMGGGTTVIPYVVTIATRFDRNRGLALGIGGAGVGLGGVILPRLVDAVDTAHGWRGGCLFLSVLIPLVALPGAWLTLNPWPAHSPAVVRPETGKLPSWRVRAFGIIALSVLLVFTIANAIAVAGLGRVFDLTGSYRIGLAIGAGLAFAAAALITRLGPYPASGLNSSPALVPRVP